jgi:hypothetical protein
MNEKQEDHSVINPFFVTLLHRTTPVQPAVIQRFSSRLQQWSGWLFGPNDNLGNLKGTSSVVLSTLHVWRNRLNHCPRAEWI